MTGYVFDDSWELERARLAGLEALYDPGTIRHLETLGVTSGWRCLEIAAGAGSIAKWLIERTGSGGSVVASDIDTRFLEVLHEPTLDIRRQDLDVDEFPEDEFDLIHGRSVTHNLKDPSRTVQLLATAVKPGGWLVLEDVDWTATLGHPDGMIVHPDEARDGFVKIWRAIAGLMRKGGYNFDVARQLPSLLVSNGLVDVGAEVRASLAWGGSPATGSAVTMIERFADDLMSTADIAEDEIDAAIALLNDPNAAVLRPAMVAAWGRKPQTGSPGGGKGLPPRTETVRSWLRTSPLFANASEIEMTRVASLADELHVEEGEQLTVEGQPGNTFFVIAKGTATVSRGGKRLVGLGPGSYFGEIALIEQGPRTATVTADSRMWLFVFDAKGFASLMNGIPSVANEIFRALAERKRNLKR